MDIVSGSSSLINGTKCLSTTGSSTIGYITWNFLSNSSTATNTNLATAAWEWEFDYQNTTGGSTNDVSVKMTAGSDAWRFYLLATSYTADTYTGDQNEADYTRGLYLTHYNGNLILRYKYGKAQNQYTDYATVPMANNNHTYQIRVERQGPNGYYNVYVLDRTAVPNTTASKLNVNIGSGPGTAYNLSFLQATSANPNRFQFDNINFYKVKLDFIPITTNPAGISNPIYPGMGNAIPFAVNVNVRGDVYIGRFVIAYTGDIRQLFANSSPNAPSLYKKPIGQTLSLTGATKLGDYGLNDTKTNQLDLSNIPEYYYSGGGTDGTTTNVINYFLYVTVLNPFNNNYPTSVSYSVSNTADDTYQQFYQSDMGPYNSSSTVSTSTPAPSGDVWDWTGSTQYFSTTSASGWLKNTSSTTLVPSASTDIVRIGFVKYNGSNQPTLTSNISVSTIEFGQLGSSGTSAAPITLDMAGNKITVSNGITLDAGANVTLNNTSSSTTSSFNISGTSSMASTSVLSISKTTTNTLTVANSGTFTLKSDASGTASIGELSSNGSFTGSYIVQRYFTATRGYRLMSFPVNTNNKLPITTAALSDFTSMKKNLLITGAGGSNNGWDQPNGYTANGPTILFYNTAGSSLTIPTTFASTTARAGQGFYFFFRGNNINNLANKVIKNGSSYATPESNVVGLQTGTLNQQGFSYPLSNAGQGYNLVGNPYPSSINITQASLGGVSGGTNNTVYTYSPNGTNITAHSVTSTSWQVASGQGFFIKALNSAASIAFSESLKSSGQPTPISTYMGTPATIQEGNILLQMVQDSLNYDLAELRFMDTYDKNYIATEDADDLNGSGQAVFFGAMTADNHQVAIASQPLEKKSTSVYLSVNDNNSGTFKINKVNVTAIPDKFDVWLIDHFKKDSINLRNDSTYTLAIDKNNAATYGNSRMEVAIRTKVLPPYQLLTFTGRRTSNNNVLNWTTKNEYTYTSFALERSFDNKTFEGVNNSVSTGTGSYTFTDQSNKPLIYYRLKQTDINENITYSSIIILKSDESSVFSVYPNPTDNILHFALTQDVKASVTLRIYNSMGTLMKIKAYTGNSGDQDVSNLTPGSYMAELVDDTTKKLIASAKFIKL